MWIECYAHYHKLVEKGFTHEKMGKNQKKLEGYRKKQKSYQQFINKMWITFQMCIKWTRCWINHPPLWKIRFFFDFLCFSFEKELDGTI